MPESTLRRILELHPLGATGEQLLWRLRSAGLRMTADEIVRDLSGLAARGEVIRDTRGRWAVVRPPLAPSSPSAPRPAPGAGETLCAVEARWERMEAADPPADLVADALPPSATLPAWPALLAYYAATQRTDPRGRIVEFPDRHATGWQLFRTSGHWWTESRLRISLAGAPESLREALMRRSVQSAAIGWPVSVFDVPEGRALIPGLILPVSWRIDGGDLVMTVDGGAPSFNPAWLSHVLRRSRWKREAELVERLAPAGEDDGLGAVADRLRHALATLGAGALRPGDLPGELGLAAEGLTNAAALFLPEDGTFTKGAADDLEALSQWSEAALADSALGALALAAPPAATDVAIPVLGPAALTDRQAEAAAAGLAGPLTVIQGPPGTGKSQVIVAMIASAVLAGRTVLFASKNHQALDEIERRIAELCPDVPLLTRGRDAEGTRSTNLLLALKQIVEGESRGAASTGLAEARDALLRQGDVHTAVLTAMSMRRDRDLALCALTERRDAIRGRLGEGAPRALGGLRAWLRALWRRLRGRAAPDPAAPLDDDAPLAEVEARIIALARLLALPDPAHAWDAEAAAETLRAQAARLLPLWAEQLTRPDGPTRRRLSERLGEITFAKLAPRRLPPEDAKAVVALRPVWAISTLSVPSRAPLVPDLFDYVVFDEASQCDIASALPLFARARHAVVVGDPMQLRFIPGLGLATEHALMDAAGLPKTGRAAIAQSVNSLFDFCDRRPGARRVFLKDQFRSTPAIVDYLSGEFYPGRGLEGRRWDDAFRPPRNTKPGLAWEDVRGRTAREDDGNVNQAEAARISHLLRRVADDASFEGSVGVLSPFNAQVALIERTVRARLSEAERQRLGLRIATIDRFQGGEADVILFSLVVAGAAPRSAVAFLQRERRRLNVAVSRARALCVIVGDLGFAQGCKVRHIEYLAHRATSPWSPPRPPFDSDAERRLDAAMRARGWEPFPQYPVGHRYLDFALDPDGRKLNVEVDGARWHTDADGARKVSDRLRDAELRARGWTVLRFWAHELSNDMGGCLDRIQREL